MCPVFLPPDVADGALPLMSALVQSLNETLLLYQSPWRPPQQWPLPALVFALSCSRIRMKPGWNAKHCSRTTHCGAPSQKSDLLTGGTPHHFQCFNLINSWSQLHINLLIFWLSFSLPTQLESQTHFTSGMRYVWLNFQFQCLECRCIFGCSSFDDSLAAAGLTSDLF